MNDITLLLIKHNGTTLDITNTVKQIKWSGRKNAAPRTLNVDLVATDGFKINVTEGDHCIFKYKNNELFQGIIMSQKQTEKKAISFKAYDRAIYLSNNKDTFSYTNVTASEVFIDVCKRFGFKYSEISPTSYRIAELACSKTTAFDAICKAMEEDYKVTGVRHYIDSQNGNLRFLTRRQNILQWVIEPGVNQISYNHSVSIEKAKTRIKLLSKENEVLISKTNSSLENYIGIFQDVNSADENLNAAQLDEVAKTFLSDNGPEQSLTINALGIPDAISGMGIFVIIPELKISNSWYIDSDTHTFKDNYYSMSLTLTSASDLSIGAEQSNLAKGQIVNFKGGNHYNASSDSVPVGGYRRGGNAKITLIAPGAKHPYHLIGGAYSEVSGDSNVYGWVDADLIGG